MREARLDTPPTLGVAFQDADHEESVNGFNTLMEAVEAAAADPDRLSAAVTAMSDYVDHTRAHFGREEEAMQAAGFPPYPMHKQAHDSTLQDLETMLGRLRAGEAEACRDWLARDFITWFHEHLASMDTVTADFLRENGYG